MGLLKKAATLRKDKENSLFYKALDIKKQEMWVSDEEYDDHSYRLGQEKYKTAKKKQKKK
jgi:hypothetical protein